MLVLRAALVSVLALALLLSGCGFKLRGQATLPFETLYIPGASAGVALDLKRNIQAGTRTRVVDHPQDAQAQLQFTELAYERNILSLTGAGRVRELQLVYRASFRVHNGKGGEYLPVNEVLMTRDLTYSDTDVLAKETEEALIVREMQLDIVQQILRRLSAAQKPVG